MPTARTNEQHCDLIVERIALALRTREIDTASDGIAQVGLTTNHVVPGRRERVFAIGHEHLGTAIERIDDHLAIRRTRNLDAAVLQVGRNRPHLPVAFADRASLRQKVRHLAGVEPSLPLLAGAQELLDTRSETNHQLA